MPTKPFSNASNTSTNQECIYIDIGGLIKLFIEPKAEYLKSSRLPE